MQPRSSTAFGVGLMVAGTLLVLGGGYVLAHAMWLSATPTWETHRDVITVRFGAAGGAVAFGLVAAALGLARVSRARRGGV